MTDSPDYSASLIALGNAIARASNMVMQARGAVLSRNRGAMEMPEREVIDFLFRDALQAGPMTREDLAIAAALEAAAVAILDRRDALVSSSFACVWSATTGSATTDPHVHHGADDALMSEMRAVAREADTLAPRLFTFCKAAHGKAISPDMKGIEYWFRVDDDGAVHDREHSS